MKIGKSILFVSLVIVLFFSCKNKPTVTTPTTQADRTVEGMAIYTKFEDFKANLYRDNDTTYVVNFWATWCKPCIEELPYFEALNENYKGSLTIFANH